MRDSTFFFGRRRIGGGSWSSAGQVGVALLCVAATVGLFNFTWDRYPVTDWLALIFAKLWGWILLFSVGCWGFGSVVLRRVLRLTALPTLEAAVLSMALGVIGFVFAMYVGGVFGLYHRGFAVVLPTVMALYGGWENRYRMLRWYETWGGTRWKATGLELIVLAYGVYCITLLYLALLTPDTLCFDTRWSHLVIAEDYAREGRLVPFQTPWPKALPHLASMVYTWAYLVPGLTVTVRWMLALHLEFTLFLWTLAGVAASVRWIESGNSTNRLSWVVYFLFPNVLVYDGNLNAGADHIAAFFALPILLTGLRASAAFDLRYCALLGVFAGAALMTKWQSAYMIVATCTWLTSCWLIVLSRRTVVGLSVDGASKPPVSVLPSWRILARAPWTVGVCVLLALGPYLIENAVYHHNPIYPLGLNIFKQSIPTQADASVIFAAMVNGSEGSATVGILSRVTTALRVLFTFSFKPHYSWTENMPWFGFLFTLLSPLALVLGPAKLRVATIVGLGSVFVWAMTYMIDRNLQVFTPILVVVTAATITRIWRLGAIARVGLIPLLLFQVVWGADAFFAHGGLEGSVRLIRSGFMKQARTRFDAFFADRVSLGNALPKNSTVLLHTIHMHLGINRRSVHDWAGFQFLIDYRDLPTPRDAFNRFKALGITHLVWTVDAAPRRIDDVVFATVAHRYAQNRATFGALQLATLSSEPPPIERPYRVLCIGDGRYPNGLYPIERLSFFEGLPPNSQSVPIPEVPVSDQSTIEQLLGKADVLVVSNSATGTWMSSQAYLSRFVEAQRYRDFSIRLRLRGVKQGEP